MLLLFFRSDSVSNWIFTSCQPYRVTSGREAGFGDAVVLLSRFGLRFGMLFFFWDGKMGSGVLLFFIWGDKVGFEVLLFFLG